MAKMTTLAEFESVFPKLEADLVAQAEQYKLPQAELEWYKKVRRSTRDKLRGWPGKSWLTWRLLV